MELRVTEFRRGVNGRIGSGPRPFDHVRRHVFGNLLNGLEVRAGWLAHAATRGETGQSVVLVWGKVPRPDGSRRILGWYEIEQPTAECAPNDGHGPAAECGE